MRPNFRALICTALTDDLSGLSIGTLPTPEPGPGEVLVRLRAASVNFPDLLTTQGKYQHRPELPFVPGIEGAGEIIAIGPSAAPAAPVAPLSPAATTAQPRDARRPSSPPASGGASPGTSTGDRSDGLLRIGDRVLVHARGGALAERIVVPDTAVRAIPASMDFATAAAFQAGALTAFVALVRRAALVRDEVLLVHGATGGVGMAAVQLGVYLGARVIATGSSDEKLAKLRNLENVETVNTANDLRGAIKAMTDGHGADVIFDPVGGDLFDASVRCIAWGGRLLVVGFAGGRIPTIAANLPLIKGFSVIGVRAGEYGRRDPVRGAQNLFAIDQLAGDGVFKPHVCARFPLENAVDALRMIADRQVFGKVVIEMPGD